MPMRYWFRGINYGHLVHSGTSNEVQEKRGPRTCPFSLPFSSLSNYLTASSFRLCSCVSAALVSTAVHFPIKCLTISLKAESKNTSTQSEHKCKPFHVHFSQIFTVYTESESLLRHFKRKKLVCKVLSGCYDVKILDFFNSINSEIL